MGRGIIRAVQDRAYRVLAALLPGGGVHDIYLTPPYHHVWFSSGDKQFNPMIGDPGKLNDDELLISFQKLYDTVGPGGSLSIILPAWATSTGDRFQRLMPNTGFTIEEVGVIYRTPGKPETELRFRKPVQESQEESLKELQASEEIVPVQLPSSEVTIDREVADSSAPPVLEISEEPRWIPPKMSRLEKTIVKAGIEIITQHQEAVPYRELLNQVYMDLVDKKIDFDSAREIETTLLNHNGREILLIEEADQANNRVVKKWMLGEQKLPREKKSRISLLRGVSSSKPKLPSVRFPFKRRKKSGYVEKTAADEE